MATTTNPSTADGARDRQRAREDRGVRSSKSVKPAERVPSPPRERRPALAALAVLLIIGGAAVAGLLALRVDERVPVLVAAREIPAGTEITAADFGETPVASDSDLLIPASRAQQLIGMFAAISVQPGQLLDETMVTDIPAVAAGKVGVGVALPAGNMPAGGLRIGDTVDVVRATEEGAEVIVSDVRVIGVVDPSEESLGTSAATRVTLQVDRDDAPPISSASAAGELHLVLIARGEPLSEQD